MKALKNSVHLLGHLGRDVEIISFESGSKRANVSLATTEYFKNAKGEFVNNTTWHNLVAWGKAAENMADLLKGHQIAIHGKLSYRNYESKGQTMYVTEIIVDEFMKVQKTEKKDKIEDEAVAVPSPI